jgi:hypothetical protein
MLMTLTQLEQLSASAARLCCRRGCVPLNMTLKAAVRLITPLLLVRGEVTKSVYTY